MGKITEFEVAQPLSGSITDVMDFFNPVRTTAQIADITDTINTVNKRTGQRVYDQTLQLLYVADGPAADDTWTLIDGLGTTQVTPS